MEFNICIDYVPISSIAGRYLFTEEGKKKSLNWKDEKRYLLPNSIDTLAISFWKLLNKSLFFISIEVIN
jgi:hypothetical protein